MGQLRLKKVKWLVRVARSLSVLPEKVGAVLIHPPTGKYTIGFNTEVGGEIHHAEQNAFRLGDALFSSSEQKELVLYTCRRPCKGCTAEVIRRGIKGAYYSTPQPEMGHLSALTQHGIPHCNYLNYPTLAEHALRRHNDTSNV